MNIEMKLGSTERIFLLLFLLFPSLLVITYSGTSDAKPDNEDYIGKSSLSQWNIMLSPACWQTSRLQGNLLKSELDRLFDRVIVIGDIHGCLPGLTEVLQKSNILPNRWDLNETCIWRNEREKGPRDRVLLIQTGDMVDRGRFTMESINCLRHLQDTALNYSSKVIRLLGNHDLMWLEGQTDEFVNKETDTPDKINAVTKQMIADILDHKLLASFGLLSFHEIPILFSHAGLRRSFKARVQLASFQSNVLNSSTSPVPIVFANYLNDIVYKDIMKCKSNYPRFDRADFNVKIYCSLRGDIYSAGKDRGGDGIGGIFWTDYSVLNDDALEVSRRLQVLPYNSDGGTVDTETSRLAFVDSYSVDKILWPFTQVVGHSLQKSSVRSVDGVQSICIDVGIYIGGRGYLEIKRDGRFISKTKNLKSKKWQTNDLTQMYC